MNYYELKDFTSIDINELVSAFQNGETITTGCISVFEDSIGRPGDRIVELKNIIEKNGNLIFDFNNNEKIIVKNCSHLVINKKVIGIQSCEIIKWTVDGIGEDSKYLDLEYRYENNKLVTKAISGEHYFRIKQHSAALLFYNW